jgi:hypothetical protein
MLTFKLRQIGTASRNLEELHLSDNTSILLDQAIQNPLEGFDNLRVLDLTECGITSWTSVEDAFGHLARFAVLLLVLYLQTDLTASRPSMSPAILSTRSSQSALLLLDSQDYGTSYFSRLP